MNKELMAKAKWVADLMAADGLTPDLVTVDSCMAYFEEVGRSIVRAQNAYLTCPESNKAMKDFVWHSLKN